MAIFSQQNEKTKIDFRNYDYSRPNRVVPYECQDDFVVYPNPCSNQLYVRSLQNVDYKIVDMFGNLMKTGFLKRNEVNIVEITEWMKGGYVIVFSSKQKVIESKHFVKK